MKQTLDGVTFELKQPFDLGFLRRYGRVFRAFDDQDSGSLCFGVQDGPERRFVKLAGAQTKRGSIPPAEAVAALRAAAPLYAALKHETLAELLETADVPGGFAMIFRWTDGICLGRQYPESRARFLSAPLQARLNAFADVGRFLVHVHRRGYVAIDFYDGSLLYDFDAGRTVICDIDCFRLKPCVNDMGRMWGSSRFMSPEEFERGAPLDELTNVYTLGATAFALFSDSRREREHWPLGDALYRAAARAVSPDRRDRPQALDRFLSEWEAAL